MIEPTYSFHATPRNHDGGLDFIGVRRLFDLPKFELHQISVIAGQCKARNRSSEAKTVDEEFGADPRNMIWTTKKQFHTRPSLLILATSSRITEDQRRDAKQKIEEIEMVPALFLTCAELEYLISKHLAHLRPVFDHCLDAAEKQQVVEYFENLRPRYEPQVTIEIGEVEQSETGQPFVVPIAVHADVVADLRLRWRYGALRNREILREITPPGIAHDCGIPLTLRHGRTDIDLKLVGYSASVHDLGSIEVLHDGTTIAESALGTIDLLEAYHPPFFRAPFELEMASFESWLAAAERDQIHVVTVTGLGGTGKTRLCRELGFLIEQRGGRWISQSHPQHNEDPYVLLLQLFASLVPGSRRAEEAGERLLRFLEEEHPSLATRAEPFLGARTGGKPAPISAQSVFGDILTVLLLNAGSDRLLGIHLSDLHWSNSLLLNILGEVVERLRSVRGDGTARVDFHIRLVLVLEGRRMEERQDGVSNTIAWETFAETHSSAGFDHRIEVRPLSKQDSARFVAHAFASTDAHDTPVPKELIPHQKRLVDTLQKHAEGTPLFITEYIRLLRLLKHLDVTRSGLVYLCRKFEAPVEIPKNVDTIIADRFAYLDAHHPDVALLVRSVAFIKDRVSRSLYERLREQVAPRASDAVVVASDFVQLPSAMHESVAFRHESYYTRVRGMSLTIEQRRQLASVYLSWLDVQAPSATTAFERGLVLEQAPDAGTDQLDQAFRTALRLANLQPLLANRILEHIVRLYPDTPDGLRELEPGRFIAYLDFNTRLLRAATNACDFPLAHGQIDAIGNAIDAVLDRAWPGDTRQRAMAHLHGAEARMQLVNISLHQMRHDLSIRAANELLRELPAMRRDVDAEWWRIEAETRNRLGIALSWDRQHERALAELEQALSLAQRHGDEVLSMFWTIDLGTAMLHVDRQRGVAMLRESAAAAARHERTPGEAWEGVWFLAETHLAAGELASLEVDTAESGDRVAAIFECVEAVSNGAHRNGWGYDEGASAIIAGACAALLGRRAEAIQWWMKSAEIGMRDEHAEFSWKAHINLAQICEHRAAAELHAQEVEKLIREDVSRRGAAGARRRAFFAAPLVQLHRVWSTVDPARAKRLANDFPEIADDWRVSAPLHVIAAPAVYFVMN